MIKNNKCFYLFLGVLILIFGLYHFSQLNRSFYQLQYDWKSKSVLKDYPIDEFIEITPYFIKIKSNYFLADNQYTYQIIGKKDYYFRFAFSEQHNDTIILQDISWIIDSPTEEILEKKIIQLDLPLKQQINDPKVAIIGDHLIYENEAKYLRKEIKETIDVHFLGNQKDVFNTSFSNIENENTNIPDEAEYVVLFSKIYPEQFYIKLNQFLSNSNKKLIIIKKPSTLYGHQSDFKLDKIRPQQKIILIDCNDIFEKNKEVYYFGDNKYLTFEAYKKIAQLISKEIK